MREISEVQFKQLLDHAIIRAGSLRAFARKAGVSAAYVSDVVNGKRGAGKAIAGAVGCRVQVRRLVVRTFSK